MRRHERRRGRHECLRHLNLKWWAGGWIAGKRCAFLVPPFHGTDGGGRIGSSLRVAEQTATELAGLPEVQQIYRGWALLGIVVIAAVILNLVLAIKLREEGSVFLLALTAFLCTLGSQVLFWLYTFPVNRMTKNWTVVPADWLRLRSQWEYSHAAGAILDLTALVLLFLVGSPAVEVRPSTGANPVENVAP